MPETQLYSGLTRRPIFVPAVGHLPARDARFDAAASRYLTGKPTGGDLRAALSDAYGGYEYVRVVEPAAGGRLEAQALNGTNRLELYVHANEKRRQAVLWGGSTISVKVPRAQQSRTSD